MDNDLAIKENINEYHRAMAENVRDAIRLLSSGEKEQARTLMKNMIIYAASVSGFRSKPLDELAAMENDDLLMEMGKMNRKAGFSPIQTIRDESLYGLILDKYMEDRVKTNVSSKKEK